MQGAAAWVTVNVAPAIVSVPVRLEATVLVATLKPTVPLPDPVAPLVTVIQVALLAALHAHPVPAVTVLLPVPPDAVNDWLAGEIAGLQGAPNEKVFVRVPPLLPPGPTASTRAS